MRAPIIKLLIAALIVTTVAAILFAAEGVTTKQNVGNELISPGLAEPAAELDEPNDEIPTMIGDSRMAIRVNVMPGNRIGCPYPYIWPGEPLIIWGNVHNGTAPYTYTWEFGDGSPPVSGGVSDPRDIAVTHTYSTMGPKTAVLTVTDASSASDVDTVKIEVFTNTLPVQVNRAVEDGLRWLYLNQWADGRWSSYGSYYAAPTAMALLAFEDNGHLPLGDYDRDIYAEYVQAGLDFLFTTFYVVDPLPVGGAGDPEEIACGNDDQNGIGIGVGTNRRGYEVGMALMAIVGSGPLGSGAENLVATTGPPGVVDSTYMQIAIDMVDWLAFAQNDPNTGSCYRGGWRYWDNFGNSDNSVSQWPAIGLEAAETLWGICAPDFVKAEMLDYWLGCSQISGGAYDGCYWYMPNWWPYGPMAMTGAGLCELSYCDVPKSDPRVVRVRECLTYTWNRGDNICQLYNMYAISKGFRIAVDGAGDVAEIIYVDTAGTINWYDYYATNLINCQASNGSWNSWGYGLGTAWGVLVLTQTVVGLPPVADIDAEDSYPPCVEIELDGSSSYHMNCSLDVVEWLWDFDISDGVDWGSPDAVGMVVTHPGDTLPPGVDADTFTVTLRVGDNSDSTMYDTDEHMIIINYENHCPVADAGGPYAGKVGDTIWLDGCASYDPDTSQCGGVLDSIISYDWDLDGDGTFGDCDTCSAHACDSCCCNGCTAWVVFDAVYSGYVGLTVSDMHGCDSADTAYVSIWTSEIDVGIEASDIWFSQSCADVGDTITISATVHCHIESDPIDSAEVRFYDGDPDVALQQIGDPQWVYNLTAGGAYTTDPVTFIMPDTFDHAIFVRVDPDQLLEEYNETNNEAFDTLCFKQCETVSSQFLPIQVYAYMAWAVEPMIGKIYLTDFPDGYLPSDIEFGSIAVNNTITPSSISVATDVPLWPGQEVLVLEFSLRDFIFTYLPVWDQTWVTWHVSGIFTDQMEFDYCDELWFFGHLSGDVNNDGMVDVSDITCLVDFLFGGGPPPRVMEQADLDHDGAVDISDLTLLVGMLF